MSSLRPYRPEDHELLQARESVFDDFGPHAVNPERSSRLDDDGGLVVSLDGDGPARGEVTWHWVQWGPTAASRCPMIGIYLRPEARGRGLGVRAQRELVDLFFRHTVTNRVEAHTDIENVAEQRALERANVELSNERWVQTMNERTGPAWAWYLSWLPGIAGLVGIAGLWAAAIRRRRRS